jgi:hypothetical protein
MIVVDQRDLPVANVDVVGDLDERGLGRRHGAECVTDRPSVAFDEVEEQVGGARLITVQDRVGEPVNRDIPTDRLA